MKLKPSKNRLSLVLVFILSVFLSCKKDTVFREVDAFSDLQNSSVYNDGQYIINFKLAKFDYKKVTVRLSSSIISFSGNNFEGQVYTAVLDQDYACKVFLNPLNAKQKYYYQITVEDMLNNIVLSDVFHFTTQ